MKARIIGGGLYFLIYLLALITKLYLILFPLFLIIGLYEIYRLQKKTDNKAYVLMYTILFTISMSLLVVLAYVNPGLVFLISLLIMLNDTMALVVGKLFGKHKLSNISPNKTIEGSIGGIILGSILTILIIHFGAIIVEKIQFQALINLLNGIEFLDGKMPLFFTVSVIITILGQIGDLMESKLKRMCKTKDSGKIIYGHGGVLDRVDSLVLAVIFTSFFII